MDVTGERMTGRQRVFGAKLNPSEQGSTLVLVTLFILVLFGFTALSIDVSRTYIEKHKAHMATDAGALAGVAKIGDPTVPTNQQASAAIAEARIIANTNGVTNDEIAAAPTNASLVDIQVGQWANGAFTAGPPPYNAVRVPAQRAVPMYFGKVVGLSQMTPVVDSVATIGVKAMQYGVPTNAVEGVTNNGTFALNWWKTDIGGSGNWGIIDLCGPTLTGVKSTEDGLTNGGCFATVGEQVPTQTGFNAGITAGFSDMCGQTVVMPLTTMYPSGSSSDIMILDFIIVQLTDTNCPSSGGTGNGSGWAFEVTLLGRGYGDLRRLGLGPIRQLVE